MVNVIAESTKGLGMCHRVRCYAVLLSRSRRLAALALAAPVFFSVVASSPAAGGDANHAGCPAETEAASGFRTYLADCRAYELVSSPFKEGFPIEVVMARSSDGSRMIGQALGAFAGTEVDNTESSEEGYGALYEFKRGASGWSTVPLGPPASVFPESFFLSESASLQRTLWRLTPSSQPAGVEDLYVREAAGAGGSCPAGDVVVPGACFEDVGPLHPPGKGPHIEETSENFVGASADLTDVLIYKTPVKGLWPGDTTTGEETKSLYEYAGGSSSEPSLVGVRNGRSVEEEALLEHKAHINEAAVLISRCGTRLGSVESNDVYNAVSASGHVVFFTALECFEEPGEPPVNELYARVGQSETVDISEPSTGPAGDCEACDTSSPTEGYFQGASQDGTKVFFLSEQAGLLPGALGENLYEYDFNGPAHEKLVRVSGAVAEPEVQGVVRVSEDGSHVYFVAGGVLAGNENANNETAQAGADNMYVYEPDPANPGHYKTSFVAMLCSGTGESGAVSDPGCQGTAEYLDAYLWSREDGRPAQATPDGRFLLFSSYGHLTPDDTSSVQQIFEYDSQTGAMVRVSKGQIVPGGSECASTKTIEQHFNCDGNIDSEELAPVVPSEGYTVRDQPAKAEGNVDVSSDGSYVFFQSADALTTGATTGLRNVYEYHDGNVYLVSDGQDTTNVNGEPAVRLLGTDASGGDVFFKTSDRLVGQDTDDQRDIYDARIEGGFPGPAISAGCSGDPCQGSPAAPPGLSFAGSASVPGGGNLSPVAPGVVKTTPKRVSRAQQLAKALKACAKKRSRTERARCKARARKRYATSARKSSARKAKQGNRNGNGRVR